MSLKDCSKRFHSLITLLKESLLSVVCSDEWETEIILSPGIIAMDVTVPSKNIDFDNIVKSLQQSSIFFFGPFTIATQILSFEMF